MKKKQTQKAIDVWSRLETYQQEIMAKLDEALEIAKTIHREQHIFCSIMA